MKSSNLLFLKCFLRIFEDTTFDCAVNGCWINSKQFSHIVIKIANLVSSETEICDVGLLAKSKPLSDIAEEEYLNSLMDFCS